MIPSTESAITTRDIIFDLKNILVKNLILT